MTNMKRNFFKNFSFLKNFFKITSFHVLIFNIYIKYNLIVWKFFYNKGIEH